MHCDCDLNWNHSNSEYLTVPINVYKQWNDDRP